MNICYFTVLIHIYDLSLFIAVRYVKTANCHISRNSFCVLHNHSLPIQFSSFMLKITMFAIFKNAKEARTRLMTSRFDAGRNEVT